MTSAALVVRVRTQERIDRRRLQLFYLTLLAVAGAAVGVAVGLRMALHATVVDCGDGHDYPAGTTDFRCFAHRHAGAGTAIVVGSVLLLLVIVAIGVVGRIVLDQQQQALDAK